MTDEKQTYDLLSTREYEVNGEKRTHYTKVGRAWPIKGGFSIQLDEGLQFTHRAVILPRKADEAQE